jgi:serine phosphatase RsbU (regulator of sigma subunit)/anti-sigma regulatory factor (Ser/Thr protein kinase)
MSSDQVFVKSVEAGGDAILVRPFSAEVFKAKIKAIQRISDLYQAIKTLQQSEQHDAQLAEQLLSRVIESKNYGLDKIGIIKKPAEIFSGDIQLTVLCPNGDINILLGDFTGHGLRSAIGAIPLAETFRKMSQKGYALLDIIKQVNSLLYDILPADLFLAGTFVTLSPHNKTVYFFNAGLPDTYLLNHEGSIKEYIPSTHLPIGVIPKLLNDAKLTVNSIDKSDHIVIVSDGVIEARNDKGEMYGEERLKDSVIDGMKHSTISKAVEASISEFCNTTTQEDDISLIDIPCGPWVDTTVAEDQFENTNSYQSYLSEEKPIWHWKLKLENERLEKLNPVPIIMNQLQEIAGKGKQWQPLYTILTELYVNALDHGVLGLDSQMKSSVEGFSEYFREREKRIKLIENGYVDININYFPLNSGGKVMLTISDSGKGFNVKEFFMRNVGINNSTFSGRGLNLVSQLCETLEYKNNGSHVEAMYLWR